MYNLKLNSTNSSSELNLHFADEKTIKSNNDLMYFFNDGKRIRFENDVLSHIDALYTTALQLTGSIENAECLIQETLLNAFNSYIDFNGYDFENWLLNILKKTHYSLAD